MDKHKSIVWFHLSMSNEEVLQIGQQYGGLFFLEMIGYC